jgi:hypothetical protein
MKERERKKMAIREKEVSFVLQGLCCSVTKRSLFLFVRVLLGLSGNS